MLHKIRLIKDGGTLDYAVVRKFLGVPLDTFKFAAITGGDRITSRAGEYHLKKGRSYPPEFTRIGFDMTWQADDNGPFLQNWHREKGLRSSLRVSFDPQKICITRDLLKSELGRGREGRFSHGDSVSIGYGSIDTLYVGFTFHQPGCADGVDIIVKNSAAGWNTPADGSAGDAEFFTPLLPLDKSGRQLAPMGFQCGPSNSTSSKPEDTGCVCDHKNQTPAGPCHYSVTLSTLKENDLRIDVWALLNPEAN